jgi:hypothetical protein
LTAISPHADESEAERRRGHAASLFAFEEEVRRQGMRPSELVRDEEMGFYRFKDGRFALSAEHADWKGLKQLGYFEAWGL